jgi:hypothetical protein
MHGRIDLPESFAAEWHKSAGNDKFSHDTLSRPGEVVRDSGFTDPDEEVDAFARRHELYHLMCITFELPESGLMFFVCLYRGSDAPAFNLVRCFPRRSSRNCGVDISWIVGLVVPGILYYALARGTALAVVPE